MLDVLYDIAANKGSPVGRAVHTMNKPKVYYLQNQAIHKARLQLEEKGVLDPWGGLDQVRELAGMINLNIQSISRLSLKQREILIDKLKDMGSSVRNPHIYESDLIQERSLSGSKSPRKIIIFSEPKESQLRMLDILASQIHWREQDGYLRFCHKILRAPRNSREVTKLRLALQSMISQQREDCSATS